LDFILKTCQNGIIADVVVGLDKDKSINLDKKDFRNRHYDGLVKTGVRMEPFQIFANKFVPTKNRDILQLTEQRSRYKSKHTVMNQNVSVREREKG
jgi:hypothetical protein